MVKMNRRQQNRAIRMLHGVLRSDVYRCCFPSLRGKSEEELLYYTLDSWRGDKPVAENAYNILCRLVGQEKVDRQVFKSVDNL